MNKWMTGLRFWFLAMAAMCGAMASAAPVISEFMAVNGGTLADEDGAFSDWIEIHNPDAAELELGGYHLSDDAADPAQWTIPAGVTIPAGGYLVVFASGKDRAVAGSELHTNFRLAGGGEYLGLVAPDGVTIVDDASFPAQDEDVSFGNGAQAILTNLTAAAVPVILVPQSVGDLPAGWEDPGYVPGAGWTVGAAPAAVGYDTTEGPVPLANVALTGTASQSTSHAAGPAQNGNDGNTGNFSHTLTDDPAPWWRLAFSGDQEIHEIVLHNRDSCCADRLRDVTVEILNEGGAVLYTSPVLNPENVLLSPSEITLDVFADHGGAVTGRIVRVRRTPDGTTNSGVLSIGEILVMVPDSGVDPGDPAQEENLAPGRSAFQTSTLLGYGAGNGINGATGDFTHTIDTDSNAAWWVDLGDRALINEITLHNRSDCCAQRLRDITVEVLAEDGVTPVFTSDLLNPENGDGSPGIIDLDLIGLTGGPVVGRTVRVSRTADPDNSGQGGTGSITDAVVLSLGEVVVTGLPVFGFNGFIRDDIEAEAFGVNASALVRIPFEVADPAEFESLALRMRYDAGFVAYLNGTEVARSNAPAVPGWDAAATAGRDLIEALQFEHHDLDAHLGLLAAGTNVLAIHMLNEAADDGNFFMAPQLIGGQVNAGSGVFLSTPTPGAANDSPWYVAKVADTAFDFNRGFYDAPFLVEITSATAGAQIRYTTDGSAPGETRGTIYTGPVEITGTTVLRALATKPTYKSTNVDTHTYIFRDDVIASGVMRASVTQDPVHGPRMRDALTDLPTVALAFSGDIDRTEKASSVELIGFGDGDVQVDSGMSRYGSYVTNFEKRNIRLYFRRAYGPGKLRYPLFRGHGRDLRPVEEFDALDLRTGSHDMSQRGFYMSNRYLDDTLLDMGHLNPHGRFVHVYVNGTYWGMYHLRERWNADMHATYLGGAKEDYEAVNSNRGGGDFTPATPYDGDGSAWANVVARRGDYESLRHYLDVEEFVDFMLMLMSGNSEAEHRAVGPTGPGSGFVLYHNDGDGFTRPPPNRTGHAGPERLLAELRAENHPDFRVLVADRIQKHYFHGGAMSSARAVARLRERTTQVERAFLAEAARWNYLTPDSWVSKRDAYINDVLSGLDQTMIAQFRGAGLLPATVAPVLSRHGGEVPGNYQLSMATTSAGTMYYTLDGSDPRMPGGAVSPGALVFSGGSTFQALVPMGAVWKYLDDGSDQGTGWRAAGFNDMLWADGPAELGYGDGDEATVVGYGGVDNNKHITTYFRKEFTLTDRASITSAGIRLKRDDGAVVYVNGTEVARPNMPPSGAIGYETPASGNAAADGATLDVIAVPTALLVDGGNVIAVEVHQLDGGSSDISFDLEMTVQRSLSGGGAVPITGNTLVRARTRNGAEWSGMTEAFFTVSGQVPLEAADLVIGEIHYNPLGTSEGTEFIELENIGTRPVNLRGTRFTTGIAFEFPKQRDTVVSPGGRMVLAGNLFRMHARYGIGVPVEGLYAGRLNNPGELLRFEDGNAGTLAEFTFGDSAPWPEAPDGTGPSLVLVRPRAGMDPANPFAWRSSTVVGGTPGWDDAVAFSGDPDADDDGNGLSNLLDHALGNSPERGVTRVTATVEPWDTGAGLESFLTVRHRANLADPALAFRFEISEDLVHWQDGPAVTELVGRQEHGDGTATLTWRAAQPLVPGVWQEFWRLVVDRD